jgi:hypothetical protein
VLTLCSTWNSGGSIPPASTINQGLGHVQCPQFTVQCWGLLPVKATGGHAA